MGILYLTQSPSSPFSAPYFEAHNSTLPGNETNTTVVPLKYTDPIPDRGWFNWNHGRIFDPVLVGYIPKPVSSSPPNDTNTDGTTGGIQGGASEEKEEKVLPPGYVDLRWKGMGVVLDFNWRRTEEGMIYEGYTGQWSPPPPPASPSPPNTTPTGANSTEESSEPEPAEKGELVDKPPKPAWWRDCDAPDLYDDNDGFELEEREKPYFKGRLDKYMKKVIKLRREAEKRAGRLWTPSWERVRLVGDL